MSRRTLLSKRQFYHLLTLPSDKTTMLQYYVLSDDDLKQIKERRLNSDNRLGLALQLCALRYPGRYLSKNETIPEEMITFISTQLGIPKSHLSDFAYIFPSVAIGTAIE